MNKSKWLTEEIIHDLYYEQGLSALEVSKKLGKSYSQIYKFMKRHNLPRRSRNETRQLQFLRSPLSFKKPAHMTFSQKQLHLAGLMLYWAEGRKAGIHTVDFTNSDPIMVEIFLKMLRQIYEINEDRLRCMLYCYVNQNPILLHEYWSKLLKIPLSKFTKPYIRQDFDLRKIDKMAHGLIHIRYSDSRLLLQIKQEIGIISTEIRQDTQAVNEVCL